VNGFTHGFYRYPARFSPLFVRAIIEKFTNPGDVILDPFMGGGTTMVEARALGRNAIGCDLNTLAVFLSKTKTTVFQSSEIAQVREWAQALPSKLNAFTDKLIPTEISLNGMDGRDTWRLRKAIQLSLRSLNQLKKSRTRNLARCIILRAAQWALDCRSTLPTIPEFRNQLMLASEEILRGATDFLEIVQSRVKNGCATRVTCINRSASTLNSHPIWARVGSPRLILTSPPYPGVHVLYHRWQIRGRQETAVPYWIAGTIDGNGASFYTFGDRKQKHLSNYFRLAEETFSSVASLCDDNSLIVQMVAFSEPDVQLPRYLEAMNNAGLREVRITSCVHESGSRIWRQVPNRKWYAEQKAGIGSASEVVLFHRKL